jgi:predicted nucleic acid-binding Zn ribbon protein
MSSITPQAVGYSWECASANCLNCQTPGCRHMCHYKPPTQRDNFDRVSKPIEMVPTPPNDAPDRPILDNAKKCSKCGTAPTNQNDKYCRKDGSPLVPIVVHCGDCGAPQPPNDLYCGNCGAILSSEISTVSPARKRKQAVSS